VRFLESDITSRIPQMAFLEWDYKKIAAEAAELHNSISYDLTIESDTEGFEYFINALGTLEYRCIVCKCVYDASPPSFEVCVMHAKSCFERVVSSTLIFFYTPRY
jgi:rubredoxin